MPYWRLSGFYFFYFAVLGGLVPYWGLYLQSLGFDPAQIGELMAVLMATKVIAPNIWGWIADHTGRRMAIVRLASLISFLVFAGVFYVSGFWQLALVMALFSFFWNASLPQFEAVTFSYLEQQVHRYSRIRLWGSVVFIVTASGVGVLVDGYDASVIPVVLFLCYLAIWLSSLPVPERPVPPHSETQEHLWRVLQRPAILAFLAACFFMQAGHGAYYAFFSIYMEQTGYSKTLIGQLWTLGVVAEILVFLVMHRLMDRWGARRVLLASLFLAAVRWVLTGYFPGELWIILAAQTLHAATFGSFHAAAIHLVHQYFTGRHQGRGQALYSSLSFGAGGAVGSLCSGYLWEGPGPTVTYLVAAGFSLLAFLVVWRWGEQPMRERQLAAG
jgi:PPP family 3-phenylpropionic acid transporter